MHTVTKVLVVFAALLSVLLAALTMAYAVNSDRIVSDRMAEVNRRIMAENLASSKVALAVEEQARLNDLIQQAGTDNSQLKSTINSLQTERTQLISEKTAAQTQAQDILNKIDQLAATTKTQALLIEKYSTEVSQLRENELGYRRREIELTDRLNDLTSQLEVAQQSTRALQEQLVEANRAIQAGATGARAAGNEQPYQPGFAVNAKIVTVGKDSATQRPIATINVGSNNQIQRNMQLSVSRGGNFIANFIVTRTDLGWAQGQLDYLGNTKIEVQPGDVVSNPHFASR